MSSTRRLTSSVKREPVNYNKAHSVNKISEIATCRKHRNWWRFRKIEDDGTQTTRLLVAKAAILSTTTMLQQQQIQQPLRKMTPSAANAAQQQRSAQSDTCRRRSFVSPSNTTMPSQRRDSMAVIADLLAATSIGGTKKIAQQTILENLIVERVLKFTCLLSLITVCINTSHTFELAPYLVWPVLFIDFLIVIIFTVEALLKVNSSGYYGHNAEYIRRRWDQFDLLMLVFHWISFFLHIYELTVKNFPTLGLSYHESFGIIRCVRPMVSIRLIRLMIKFKLPRNRIQQLLRRSSSQVQNVTVFFVFFMAFYAIMGIQLFAHMDYHCVIPGTDPKNVTINDLAIPDTMCSPPGGGGYECPDNMECMKVDLSAKGQGFYGMFDHFGASVFTVYLAASEEGWVYVLYDCLDSFPSHIAFIYFVTLIFFLAWLVKNVFIAVITETFAEIRVQFSEMWQKKEVTIDDDFKQRIEKTEDGWRLVRFDKENKNVGARVRKFQAILRSTAFQCVLVSLVLANAAIHATFVYRHDESDASRREIYYYIECGFTLFFNIECLVKILCYGFRAYFKRNIFKFEFILCVGSSLNVIKFFYDRNVFTYFQLFRILRLIKASPMLEDFVYKIFSPGKKLGGLVIFTVTFVIIASAVSLQLFCSVPHLHHFQTFPQAFMSMFQIITQEGWTEFVVEVLRMVDDRMVPFVAIYFVAYHLFVTLILLSLFVAVILDNLEMDEELKKVKQLKAKEAISSMRTTLPWRLRVFDKFPTRPQMVRLRKQLDGGEFPTPRLRDSFANQFIQECEEIGHFPSAYKELEEQGNRKVILKGIEQKLQHYPLLYARHVGHLTIRASVYMLIRNATQNSTLRSDIQNRSKSIGFFEKILTTENGDIGGGRGGGGVGAVDSGAPSNTATNANADSSSRNPTFGGGGGARRFGTAGAEVNQLQIDFRILQQKRQIAEMTRNRIEEDMRENHPYFDRPLFVVGRDSKLRKFCYKVVHTRYCPSATSEATTNATNGGKGGSTGSASGGKRYKQFHQLIGLMPYLDWAMVVFTLISCVSMLFESPWPTTGENLVMNNIYLQVPDYLFVMAMTFELWSKVISGGLFFTPHALVRDAGGIMTIFIYFTSLIFLLTMPRHVEINSSAQFLMICRAMRPLRIYTLVPHIRRVVVELIRGFKEILMVTILMIIILFIFASFGVQSVGGKLAACNDATVHSRQNCTGVFWQKIFVTRMEVYGKNSEDLHPKILVPRVWTNPRNFNFDHIGNAMLALFETLSFKGWNVIRDILWARQGPWAVVFIHIFVFIGCMIGLTLFVGVVIANYTENRGTALLTVDQRRWQDLKARLKMAQPLHVPPKPSTDSLFRRKLYQFTMSRFFNQIFAVLVILNSATLVLPWNVEEEDEKHQLLYFVTALSAVINCLFAVEILLKVSAFTASGFWQSRRNRIDLLITAMGILWVITHFFIALPASVVGGATRLKKFTYTFGYVVVVLRFFTIASRNTTLKMLMLTVVMSMFRSFFIIMTMALLMLFYAYTGVILFGMVKYGQAVSKHVNFRSGSEALVVLFRSITGEDWNDIMHDSSRSAPFCYWRPGINYWESDCGNFYGAIIYFCSFYLIITYIVRNLLVAIIMENFSLFYSSEEDALLSYADIRNFQLVWNMVDVEQKNAIPVPRVKFLLRLLKGRLEVDPNKDRLLFKHMCYEMEKLRNGEDVSFHDVLYMLSYRSVDIRKSLQLEELLQREELEYVIEEEVAKQTIKLWLEFCLRKMRKVSRKESANVGFPLNSLRSVFGFEGPVHSKLSVIPSSQNIAGSAINISENNNDTATTGGHKPDGVEKSKETPKGVENPPNFHKVLLAGTNKYAGSGGRGSFSGAENDSVGSSPSHTIIGTAELVRNDSTSRSEFAANAAALQRRGTLNDSTATTPLVVAALNPAVTGFNTATSVSNVQTPPPKIMHDSNNTRSRRKSINDVIEEAARRFISGNSDGISGAASALGALKKASWTAQSGSESFDTTTAERLSPIRTMPIRRHQPQRSHSPKHLSARDLPEQNDDKYLNLTSSPFPHLQYHGNRAAELIIHQHQQNYQNTTPYTPPAYTSNLMPENIFQPPIRKISGIMPQPTLHTSLTGTTSLAPSENVSAMCQFLLYQNEQIQKSYHQKNSAAVEEIKDWWNNFSANQTDN